MKLRLLGAVYVSVGIFIGFTLDSMQSAHAALVIDFEGLNDLETIDEFYNGGFGGLGSGPGPNLGVSFGSGQAIIDADAGGTGNFGGEPSPDTALFWFDQDGAVFNIPGGFDTSFSVFYSAPFLAGSVTIYDGLDSTGTIIATLLLPTTGSNGGDPNGIFSPFVSTGITFTGTALSVDFSGTVNQIAFDNLTLGSTVPIPAAAWLFGSGLLGMIGIARKRKHIH